MPVDERKSMDELAEKTENSSESKPKLHNAGKNFIAKGIFRHVSRDSIFLILSSRIQV